MTPPRLVRSFWLVCLVLACGSAGLSDPRVAVTATANPAYSQRKFGDGKAAVESYVFMQGHYFAGHTVDRSIERMPFRHIAEYLGTELFRQNFVPAPSLKEAQLLIVVHWGTTTPAVTSQEMSGQTSLTSDNPGDESIRANALANPVDPPALPPPPDTSRAPEANDMDRLDDDLIGNITRGNGATLLGYSEELLRLRKKAWSGTKDEILNFHLTHERYFITLLAYDLKEESLPGHARRPVWSIHLNISSPGNNFHTALDRIGPVAANFAGRSTDGMQTIRPNERTGTVNLAPLIILGEAREAASRAR